MKKSSIIASFSGALVAASLALAGPAAAAGHGHGAGPAAPGHEAGEAAPAAAVERPSSPGMSTPAPAALSAPSTRLESSGGFAPTGLDGFGSGRAAAGEAAPAAAAERPSSPAVSTPAPAVGSELPIAPVG